MPTGYAEFPKEIVRPPRSIAEKTYTDIRRWTVMPKGGHFAALEQPEALAAEVREFFRPLREAAASRQDSGTEKPRAARAVVRRPA